MKNIPFKIIMSRGDDIPIDTDELEKVLQAIQRKSPAMMRAGIFNPSFYVSIVKDTKRLDEWYDELLYIQQEDKKAQERERGPKQLEDMFAELRDKMRMIADPTQRTSLQEGVAREERKSN